MFETIPKLTPHAAQQLLADVYETKFGICDHISTRNKHPFAGILVNPATDLGGLDSISGLIRYYIANDVSKYVPGLTLSDFLDLPHEYFQTVIEEVQKKQARSSKDNSELENKLRNIKP